MRDAARGLERVGGLTGTERTRLANILAMLGSPNDHERVVAARMATAFVEQHGLWWDDLAEAARPRAEPREIVVAPRAGAYGITRRSSAGREIDLIG